MPSSAITMAVLISKFYKHLGVHSFLMKINLKQLYSNLFIKIKITMFNQLRSQGLI